MKLCDFRNIAANEIFNSPTLPPEQKDMMTATFIADEIIRHYSNYIYSSACAGKEVFPETLSKMMQALSRKLSGEPIQYIFGEWEFYGNRIFCGPGCLIPRPETEFLVDFAVSNLPENAVFCDLCTGSGCIAVAILKSRPDVSCICVDISDDALRFARKNLEYHGLCERVQVISADILDYETDKKFDMILSNPPYIKSSDMNSLSEEVKKEPAIALDGGADGLLYYETIIRRFTKNLKKNASFAFEVGYDTYESVESLLKDSGFETQKIRDYSDVFRVVTGSRSGI